VEGMCLNRNTDLKSVTRQEPNLKDQMYRPLAIYGGACDVTFEYSIIKSFACTLHMTQPTADTLTPMHGGGVPQTRRKSSALPPIKMAITRKTNS
jgi:hypothetical protein